MIFDAPLVRGRLLRRYKRFLADVMLEDGGEVTAHCANPGAMLGLNTPGLPVWLEPSRNPQRRLAWSWRLAEPDGGPLVGIDTTLPNQLVAEALAADAVPELTGYHWRREVRYGATSRIDFNGTAADGGQIWLEVKNVHLRRHDDWAEFPDCVTTRGARHLRDLASLAQSGHRAVMLYVVQRGDCARFRPATDLDPAYAAAFAQARRQGVEVLAYGTALTHRGIRLGHAMPAQDPAPAAAGLHRRSRHG
jgi:sugar fermentation stimulation protein A